MLAGLTAGAGAADGLETLLARMRAEEKLQQNQRGLDLERRGQDITSANNSAVDRYRMAELEQLGPVRAATARGGEADADIAENRAAVLRGLRPILEGGNQPEAPVSTLPPPNSASGAPVSGVASLNNPVGRLRLHMADISPNGIFGAVDTASSEWEVEMDAYARKLGKGNRNDLTWDEIQTARMDPNLPERMRIAAERLELAKAGLDLTRNRDTFNQRMSTERLELAKSRFESELPSHLAQMALSEFADRIKREIGADDPPAKYNQIRAEIMDKYKRPEAAESDVQWGRDANGRPIPLR